MVREPHHEPLVRLAVRPGFSKLGRESAVTAHQARETDLLETKAQHFVIIGRWVAAPVTVAGQKI
jgi:hypothetical protein